jgi:Flp pilus assembly protein TadD
MSTTLRAPLILGWILAAMACGGGARLDGAPQEARRSPPPPASAEVAQAEQALAGGDVATARSLFQRALDRQPDDARAHFGMGLILETDDDWDGAQAAYRSALQHDPSFAEARSNLGALLREQGQLEEAIRELRAAVDVDPRLASAHANLALALEDAGDLAGAEQSYRKALSLEAGAVMTRANLGLLLVRRGDLDAGAGELQRALRDKPSDRATLLAIGQGLRMAGKPGPALQAMRAAVDNGEPPTPALLAELALAERASGDRAAAVATLRRALSLDTRYGTAHYLLGNLLAADGQFKEAVRHYQRYLELEPQGSHAAQARERLGVAKNQLR